MNKDLSPDLNNGITRAIFISWGTTPELRDKLIIYVNGALINLKDSLTTFIEILATLRSTTARLWYGKSGKDYFR